MTKETSKPIRISWQMAISMNTMVCKMCRLHNIKDSPFYKHGFAMELCQTHNLYPIYKIPYWQNRLRALLRKHYKEYHPEYEIK